MEIAIESPQEKYRLSCPASRREWYRVEGDAWATRPWTITGVLECKRAGGWFASGQHEFDNGGTASAAYSRGGEATPAIRKYKAAKSLADIPAQTAEELLAELWGAAP